VTHFRTDQNPIWLTDRPVLIEHGALVFAFFDHLFAFHCEIMYIAVYIALRTHGPILGRVWRCQFSNQPQCSPCNRFPAQPEAFLRAQACITEYGCDRSHKFWCRRQIERKAWDFPGCAWKNGSSTTRIADEPTSAGPSRKALGKRGQTGRGLDMGCADPQWSR